MTYDDYYTECIYGLRFKINENNNITKYWYDNKEYKNLYFPIACGDFFYVGKKIDLFTSYDLVDIENSLLHDLELFCKLNNLKYTTVQIHSIMLLDLF